MILTLLLLQGLDLDGLRSDDPADRDRAEAALSELPFFRAPEIRAAAEVERDPEAKARLRAIRGRLLLRESDAIYRTGRLQDSLKKRVEDVEGEFERRSAWVGDAIYEGLAPVLGCEIQAARRDATAALVRRLGRWTYPALLEGLRKPITRFQAIQAFKVAGPDAYPALREALRGAEPDVAFGLLEVFLDQKAWAELEALSADPGLGESTRACATRFLRHRP